MYHELSDNADGVQVDIFGILSHNLSMTSLPFEFKTQLENASLYIVLLWFLNQVVPVLSQYTCILLFVHALLSLYFVLFRSVP